MSLLANLFVTEEISSSLDVNAIFLLAIFAVMLTRSYQNTLRVIDAIILLEMSYGYFFSVMSLFGCRTKFYGKVFISVMGTYVRLFLTAATSVYSVWFWFDGIYKLPSGDCDPTMFLFANLPVRGHVRYFWRVMALICAIYFGVLFLLGFCSTLMFFVLLMFSPERAPGDSQRSGWGKFWDFATASSADHMQATTDAKTYSLSFFSPPHHMSSS
jgi:hypothetical protein